MHKKILEEQTDSKMERLISTMQDQNRLLKKDLKDAHDQIATHTATATPTAALATILASTIAAAQLPPPAPAQPSPPAPAQPPPPTPPATSTRDVLKKLPNISRRADSRTDDLPAASSVGKRGTSSPTVRPAQSSNASCSSKCELAPATCL